MKGAMAEPLAKIIKAPKNNSVSMMGNSQNFFLTLRKPHKSLKKFMTQLLDINEVNEKPQEGADCKPASHFLSIRVSHIFPLDGSLAHYKHRAPALFPFLQLQGIGPA